MPLIDYRCDEGHVTERVIFGPRPGSIACPCGALAWRQWSMVNIVPPEVDSRNMFRRFSEASAEMEHRGEAGPNLWTASKRLAQAAHRAGEIPWKEH